MSFITKEGIWAPAGHQPNVPVSQGEDDVRPATGVAGYWYPNPYVNHELWKRSVSQAAPPRNMWEMVKFAGEIYSRQLETLPLGIAEWPAIGRGTYLPRVQSPNVVGGNVYLAATVDRYGPFREPRMTQTALAAFEAWASPRQVNALNAQTTLTGPSSPGYGSPGG